MKQRHGRRRAQRDQPRGEDARHQHRQHQQRRIVEARAGIQQVQQPEGQQVHADGRQPLVTAQLGPGVRRAQFAQAGQDPQQRSLRGIQQAQRHRHRMHAHAEQAGHHLRTHQRQPDGHARGHIGTHDAHQRPARGMGHPARLA
jgi:hypothetical protein